MNQEGLGAHQFWGVSPTFDCLEVYHRAQGTSAALVESKGQKKKLKKKLAGVDPNDPINIFLSQPGDIRHVLKTLASRRRRKKRPIHFYISEPTVETMARHCVLMRILCDWELPIRYRTNTFLEVFGNATIQKRTEQYLDVLAKEMIHLVCDGDGECGLDELFDFSLLKYKTKDALESTFKTWAKSVPFDTKRYYDARLRALYKDRYDFRRNVLDWDYHDRLKPHAGIVHIRQYREWRQNGIAFEFGDQKYTQPNRTLTSYAEGKTNGRSNMRRGYWGDICCSPYLSFGIDSEVNNKHAAGLFEIINKNSGSEQHRHHAVEVAVHTVVSALFEIENGSIYRMSQAHEVYSGISGKDEEEYEREMKKLAEERKAAMDAEAAAAEEDEKVKDEPKSPARDGSKAAMATQVSTTEEIETVDTPGVRAMKYKDLSTEEQLARGDGEYDSDDDPDSELEQEETPAPAAPPAPSTMAAPPAPPSDDAITSDVNKEAPVAAEEAGADTPPMEKPETAEERKNREEEEAAALERAGRIMEILEDAKIFLMDLSLKDLMAKPKKRYQNLFDMVYFSYLTAGTLAEAEKMKSFLKPKAVVAVEGIRSVVGLTEEHRTAYGANIDGFAQAMGLKSADEKAGPKFWWRDIPDPYPDTTKKVSKEKQTELDAEKLSNEKRTKWDNGLAIYTYSNAL